MQKIHIKNFLVKSLLAMFIFVGVSSEVLAAGTCSSVEITGINNLKAGEKVKTSLYCETHCKNKGNKFNFDGWGDTYCEKDDVCSDSDKSSIAALEAGDKIEISDICYQECQDAYSGNLAYEEGGKHYCENTDGSDADATDATSGAAATTAGDQNDAQAEDEPDYTPDPADFEVALQAPFARPPEKKSCDYPTEDHYVLTNYDTNAAGQYVGGYIWLCRSGASEWQQVIRGNDGNEILTSFSRMLYKWLAGFIGVIAVLMLIVGGIQISVAGASQEGLQDGKNRITASLVGLAILFLSSAILYTINPTFFGQNVELDSVLYDQATGGATTTAKKASAPKDDSTDSGSSMTGTYTHDEAVKELRGFTLTSTSGPSIKYVCANRSVCKTSFEDIQKATVHGLKAIQKASGAGALVIVGGSEKSFHSKNSPHYKGKAVDIDDNNIPGDRLYSWVKEQDPTGVDLYYQSGPKKGQKLGTQYEFSYEGYNFKFLVENDHYHLTVN